MAKINRRNRFAKSKTEFDRLDTRARRVKAWILDGREHELKALRARGYSRGYAMSLIVKLNSNEIEQLTEE